MYGNILVMSEPLELDAAKEADASDRDASLVTDEAMKQKIVDSGLPLLLQERILVAAIRDT